MKKKIALTLTTLGLALALSACNNDTAGVNQIGYNPKGTTIQSNIRGTYDSRNAMLDNRGWTNTGVRNGYQVYTAPNRYTNNTSIYKANTTNRQQPLIGYARIGEGMSAKANSTAQNVYVDRQMLANAIAGVTKNIPGVKNVTVITTDKQAIVGCDTRGLNANQARNLLQKVQNQASSICPRYYKVHTSNNPNALDKLQRNASTLLNKTDGEILKLIGK